MMMVDVIKLTKEGFEERNNFHCYHNNLGYCRFREKCRYQHYFDVCSKSICREKDAPIDIPKHASMGINADFKKEMCVHIIIEITI